MTEKKQVAPKKASDKFRKEAILASLDKADKIIAESLLEDGKSYAIAEAQGIIANWKKEEFK